MRRILCACLVGCVVLAASGCAQFSKDSIVANRTVVKGLAEDRSMTESYIEHLHRLTAVVDQDARALVDDWDTLWQRDRPTRLTRWHTP
ncbi:MAG: hypothetical protein ACYSVY_16145 [Planctomycetota bacterium]